MWREAISAMEENNVKALDQVHKCKGSRGDPELPVSTLESWFQGMPAHSPSGRRCAQGRPPLALGPSCRTLTRTTQGRAQGLLIAQGQCSSVGGL